MGLLPDINKPPLQRVAVALNDARIKLRGSTTPKTAAGKKNRYDRRVVPTMVNVRGIPYVTLDRLTPTGKESDEQTRAYRRTPAVGDSGDTAATARLRVVPLARTALMVPSYLLMGYFAPAFGNPVTGGCGGRD